MQSILKHTMALTKGDLQQIQQVIVDTVGPMFVHQTEELNGRMDRLENRMDGLESRMDGLEKSLKGFKYDVNQRFIALEEKINNLESSLTERIENLTEDINLLYSLVDRMQHEQISPGEKAFLKLTVEKQLPIAYRALEKIAHESGIPLPVPHPPQK